MKRLTALFFLAVLLYSCSTPDETSTPTPVNETKILAVGYRSNTPGGISYTSGQDVFTNFSSSNGEAKVFKKGEDVYISAMQNTSGSLKKIGYYKNGTFTEVGSGFSVRNIYVDASNNVYLCGTNEQGYPCYWKNTQMTTLVAKQGKATDMEIVGSDVYVSGTYFFNDRTYVIASWKNGVESTYGSLNLYNNQFLPNTLIEVEGSDVYVHGSLATGPKLWKNGQDTSLTFGLATEEFKAVGTVFYYVGRSYDGTNQAASVGSNGSFSRISTAASLVNDFKIKGTDIYYCGVEANRATLWKNATVLKKSDTDNTYFTDVWVE
jgi:hypothetical protein